MTALNRAIRKMKGGRVALCIMLSKASGEFLGWVWWIHGQVSLYEKINRVKPGAAILDPAMGSCGWGHWKNLLGLHLGRLDLGSLIAYEILEHIVFKFRLISPICQLISELLSVCSYTDVKEASENNVYGWAFAPKMSEQCSQHHVIGLCPLFRSLFGLDVQRNSNPAFLRMLHGRDNYTVKCKLTSCIYLVLRINDLSFSLCLPAGWHISLKSCYRKYKKWCAAYVYVQE